MNTATIPSGYWQDTRGNLVPEANVRPIDKLRDQVVRDLCAEARKLQLSLTAFKRGAMDDVTALVLTSMEQYGVKTGGNKGNLTLYSFDGKFKVVRQMADRISFGEQLQAAKVLIDQCVQRWLDEGANSNLRVIVEDAFQVDKEGKISTDRVLRLRAYEMKNAPEWEQAMQAISDSIRVVDTKPYIRFYERDERGVYQAISLDLAAV